MAYVTSMGFDMARLGNGRSSLGLAHRASSLDNGAIYEESVPAPTSKRFLHA